MDTTHTLYPVQTPLLERLRKEIALRNSQQHELQEKIIKLKKEKNAVILAHYYQRPEIQDIADYVGDSLGLSRKAGEIDADIIVFAGVSFMAETAKILNPDKKVLIPEPSAGCSLADSCPPETFAEFVKAHPDHLVVTYINCSAEVKALSDFVCTSSNALEVIQSLPDDKPVIFAPDRNLGKYLMQFSGRDFLLWDGSCYVHEAFDIEKLVQLCRKYPDAWIIAHPECEEDILHAAHFIGSTEGLLSFVKRYPEDTFIVATEVGILHEMRKQVPTATLIAAPAEGPDGCNFSECSNMKMNTLQKIYDCLYLEAPQVLLSESIMDRARVPIRRMLDLTTPVDDYR